MYDILIKGGLVIDGSGNPAVIKDVAVTADKIAAVGDSIDEKDAKKVIDAKGKFVAPGFIDITSHSDVTWTIFDYPGQESLLAQGVTTIIAGNCGTSLAPLVSKEAIKAVQKWTDISKINTDWLTVAEFLGTLEKRKMGVNFGTMVGHGTLRRGLIGEEIRALEQQEIKKIKYLIEEAMAQGAFGLSSALAYAHEQPATQDEMANFAKAVKERGGVYKTHIRSEGKEGFLAAVNETIGLARETEIPIIVSHFKAIGRKEWPYVAKALEMIKTARAGGIKITFDVFPYLRTGSFLYQLLPRWAREGGFVKIIERLRDPAMFAKVIIDLQKMTLHYNRIVIASCPDTQAVGKTIREIAAKSRLTPEEVLAELLIVNEGRVVIFNRNLSAKNLVKFISFPESFVASDGAGYSLEHQKTGNLVHPRSFGTFTHFLHHFVRDTKLVGWEEAIKKISSGPADFMGIKKRGYIKNGYFADVVVFDKEMLADFSTYSNPYAYSAGMDLVLVNGIAAIENGGFTGNLGGRVIRKA